MSHMSNGIKCPSCELGINRKWMGWDVVKTSTSSVSPSCEAISHLICRFAYFLMNWVQENYLTSLANRRKSK